MSWKQITDWYGNSTLIHYASLWALLAGFGFVLLRVTMLCGRMWRSLRGKSPFWKIPLPLLYAKILTEFHGTSLALVSLIGFAAGCGVTYSYMNTQRVDRERELKIKVHERIDSRHAIVDYLDQRGNLLAISKKFSTCPGDVAPSFDVGHTYNVKFEISSTDRGECNTFTGPNGHFEEAK